MKPQKAESALFSHIAVPLAMGVAVVVLSCLGSLEAQTALLCAGFMLLSGWKLGFAGYMALFCGVTLALCALFWLRNKGCSRFALL